MSCSIVDFRCRAYCLCTDGYSGKECTLNIAAQGKRNNVRYVHRPTIIIISNLAVSIDATFTTIK